MIQNSNERISYTVLEVRQLAGKVVLIRFERLGLDFLPGQYLNVGLQGKREQREYSIHSKPTDPFLELFSVKPGDALNVEGPFGFFLLDKRAMDFQHLFVATGTGISPFVSFVRSHAALNYQVVHGVRTSDQAFSRDSFFPDRHNLCVTSGSGGDYPGRVTSWLKENPVLPQTMCYLCGNCEMIYEVRDILRQQGIAADQIFSEVYF